MQTTDQSTLSSHHRGTFDSQLTNKASPLSLLNSFLIKLLHLTLATQISLHCSLFLKEAPSTYVIPKKFHPFPEQSYTLSSDTDQALTHYYLEHLYTCFQWLFILKNTSLPSKTVHMCEVHHVAPLYHSHSHYILLSTLVSTSWSYYHCNKSFSFPTSSLLTFSSIQNLTST